MISLSEQAAQKVQSFLQKRGKGLGLRISVKTTGCSGLAYVMEYVDQPKLEDQIIESMNCQIFVDPKSSVYLKGLEIDWVKQGLNEGFKFVNPNERDRCGCGESFTV